MVKTLTSKSVYKVVDGKHVALVTLSRIKNTIEGCPRFEAQVIYMPYGEIAEYFTSATFRFKGHYYCDKDEAEWLVKTMYN